ncbi:MAG: hypothetical protein ACK6DP_14550 [Gemmatimonas sp.]|uniref:hypothetical protein n=1 Tax=Gemmatimonas sp. TaxID=1962908 RepID=UPI00391F512A|nr:hypothetical protein [Gemmatimonadota bacterium]
MRYRTEERTQRLADGGDLAAPAGRTGAREDGALPGEDERGVLDEGRVRECVVGRQRDECAAVALEGGTVRGMLDEGAVDVGAAQINRGQPLRESAPRRPYDGVRKAGEQMVLRRS